MNKAIIIVIIVIIIIITIITIMQLALIFSIQIQIMQDSEVPSIMALHGLLAPSFSETDIKWIHVAVKLIIAFEAAVPLHNLYTFSIIHALDAPQVLRRNPDS